MGQRVVGLMMGSGVREEVGCLVAAEAGDYVLRGMKCGGVLDDLNPRRSLISACRGPDCWSANKGEIEEVCGRGVLGGLRGAV